MVVSRIMRSLLVVVTLMVSTSSVALGDGYACPPSRNGEARCPVEQTTPEGCPLHFLLAHQPARATIQATVTRAGQTVDVTGTVTTTTVDRSVGTKDYYSCDCAEISGPQPFDEYALSVTGATAGELVALSDPVNAVVTIGPPGACTPFTYTTDFYINIACDLCPPPPGDSGAPSDGGAGCATGSASSGWLLLALSLAIGRLRGSRRSRG